jgi:hypothetical protein
VLDVLHHPVLARERALHGHERQLRIAHEGDEEPPRASRRLAPSLPSTKL